MGPYRPRIGNDFDLERAWRIIAPPDEPRPHAFWIMLIGAEDRAFTQVIEVEEAFGIPPSDRSRVFPDFVSELVGGATAAVERLAFLRTRPGHFGPTDDDLAWAGCLYGVARDAGLPCETVFLATDLLLVPMPWGRHTVGVDPHDPRLEAAKGPIRIRRAR